MLHPCTISKNTLKVYHVENVLKQSNRVLSVNLNQWRENVPKRLRDLCIDAIANKWEVLPLINELPLISDITQLLDVLKPELPLELTVPKVAYETYWLKCYQSRWPKHPPADKSFSEVEDLTWARKEVLNSTCSSLENINNAESDKTSLEQNSSYKEIKEKTWKELFLEMHVQKYLEHLDVEDYDHEKIKSLANLCRRYITVLKLKELRAPTSTNIPDHIPLNLLLTEFSNLKELALCFKQKYVDEKFSWHIFNTTMIDIKNLCKGLECSQLEILRIQNSDINCTKLKMILKALAKNDNLKQLEFSHCKIADHGAMAISKFLKQRHILKLNLVNNYIGYEGTKSLAYVLMENEHLTHLNLRLNIINSKGGKYLFFALAKGKNRLVDLNLAGCGLNYRNVEIEEMIRCNEVLHSLDLSNNRMGKEIGRLILNGLAFNTTLKNLNCRRCEFSSDIETKMSDIGEKNKLGIRSKEVCWDPPEHPIQETADEMFPLEFLKDFNDVLSD